MTDDIACQLRAQA